VLLEDTPEVVRKVASVYLRTRSPTKFARCQVEETETLREDGEEKRRGCRCQTSSHHQHPPRSTTHLSLVVSSGGERASILQRRQQWRIAHFTSSDVEPRGASAANAEISGERKRFPTNGLWPAEPRFAPDMAYDASLAGSFSTHIIGSPEMAWSCCKLQPF